MNKIVIFLILVFIAGCGSQGVLITPDSVHNKGLVVGHISNSDWGRNLSATNWQLVINGKKYDGALRRGYIVLPLAPGNYQLDSLFNYSVASMGAVSNASSSTLPIKAKFTVKNGEITNLGEIFLLTRKKKSSEYLRFFLKNDSDMHAYLRRKHADVYQKFRNKKFNLANVVYVKKNNINKVKRAGLEQSTQLNKHVVVGTLGSIAITKRNKQGSITSINFVNTGTFNRPHSCTFGKVKTACIIPNLNGDKIFLAHKTKYKVFKKPAQFTGGRFYMLKDDSILWMNADFTFYRTKNRGKNWQANTRYKKNVEMSFWEELGGSIKIPKISQTRKGFYIYAKADLDTIIYIPFQSGKAKYFTVPVKGEGVDEIVETAKGLYVKTDSNSYFSNSNIYFKAYNQTQWSKRVIPKSICRQLKVKDYQKAIISVSCRDQHVFQTADLGVSWKRIK